MILGSSLTLAASI
ncbi:hypothetical protein LINPERPRIM_LOCUS40460 [Linum perenne]